MKFYIKELVYGANDGIITTFAVVAGVVGAELTSRVILIIGLASLIADGFSMAASDYLSSKSQNAVADQEAVTSPLQTHPIKGALLTFGAFVLAGAIPLLPYIVAGNSRNVFEYTALATALALFAIGALRTLVTKRHMVVAGLEMVAVGGAAAVLAYLAGYWISRLTPGSG